MPSLSKIGDLSCITYCLVLLGFLMDTLLRSAHTMGLVPATSPCNKSQGLVASCELTIFATKSVAGTKIWSLRLDYEAAHTMGLVPATKSQGLVASCELTIFAAKSSIYNRLDFEAVHTMRLVPATFCRD